jgi:hypothetical protein
MSVPATVPDELLGCWQRDWIEFSDGTRDETSFVVWLQLPSLMADVRLSSAAMALAAAGLARFADCSPTQRRLLAASDSSAGTTACTPFVAGADGVPRATATWSSTVGFQPVSAFPEPGLLELSSDGTVMIERAPSGAYVEQWRLLPGTRRPLACTTLTGGATWYPAGNVGVLVHDRRLGGEALDCEFSFAREAHGAWVVERSTLPWRVGAVISPV